MIRDTKVEICSDNSAHRALKLFDSGGCRFMVPEKGFISEFFLFSKFHNSKGLRIFDAVKGPDRTNSGSLDQRFFLYFRISFPMVYKNMVKGGNPHKTLPSFKSNNKDESC